MVGMNNLLKDKHGRYIKYLRISVTDRCNLRCIYCMPESGIKLIDRDEILSYSEIIRIAKIFINLGVEKIRITGGEPLIREDINNLITDLINISADISVAITTNGTLLDRYVKDFATAGLKKINVSLDTLNETKYANITRNNFFKPNRILENIEKALKLGINDIKINSVIVNPNDEENIFNLIRIALALQISVRFIEVMPTSSLVNETVSYIECGEINNNLNNYFLNNTEGNNKSFSEKIINILRSFGKVKKVNNLNELGPAIYFNVNDSVGKVGIISNDINYCQFCNRVRLTSDGKLKLCLYSDKSIDIKNFLRNSYTDLEIAEEIRKYIMNKPYNKFSSLSIKNNNQLILLPEFMNKIGG